MKNELASGGPFRVHISRLGVGYLAESETLRISVGGASAIDAAEKARTAAIAVLNAALNAPLPTTLFARIDEDGLVAFVMRPFARPFDLNADAETFYVDSNGQSYRQQKENSG